jgi:hypothetical protein
MPDGYKCVHVTVKVDDATVGVVDSMSIELERDGGVEHVYGQETGLQIIGGKKGTFNARRLFMVDTDTDLFVDLFDLKLPFSLSGEINGVANSKLTLSNCIAYRYRPVFGAPNDKVGEEISGEAVTWVSEI